MARAPRSRRQRSTGDLFTICTVKAMVLVERSCDYGLLSWDATKAHLTSFYDEVYINM